MPARGFLATPQAVLPLQPTPAAVLAAVGRQIPGDASRHVLMVGPTGGSSHPWLDPLRQAGWRVSAASSRPEALEQLAVDPPSLVLLNLLLPLMEGFALAEDLRANARWQGIPLVVWTDADPDAWALGMLQEGRFVRNAQRPGPIPERLLALAGAFVRG